MIGKVKSIILSQYIIDMGVDMIGKGRWIKLSNGLIGMILLTMVLVLTPTDINAHAPEDMTLSYDYFTQILNVSISHTGYQSQHFIETIEIFKNNISVHDETYAEQNELRELYYEFEVFAEDGDILRVIATCNLVGSEEAEITVVGPRERMDISVNEIEELEMGDEWDFTVNIEQVNNGDPVEGVVLEGAARLVHGLLEFALIDQITRVGTEGLAEVPAGTQGICADRGHYHGDPCEQNGSGPRAPVARGSEDFQDAP